MKHRLFPRPLLAFCLLQTALQLPAQTLTWAKVFESTSIVSGTDIEIGPDNKVYMVGLFEGTCDFDPGPGTLNMTSTGLTDLFFAKYDTSGVPIWVKTVEGTSWEDGYNIEVDHNLNVVLAGDYSVSPDFDPGPGVVSLPSDPSINAFVAKYDLLGNLVWAKGIYGPGDDIAQALVIEADDHILVGGFFEDSVDMDPGPAVDMRKSKGSKDMFMARFDRLGNYDWAFTAGGKFDDQVTCIISDDKGNILCSGAFKDTVDFDPGPGVDQRVSHGLLDMFWSAFDTSGAYLGRTFAIGGGGTETAYRIRQDAASSLIVAGSFDGTIDFDTSAAVVTLTSIGVDPDGFVAKYDSTGTLVFVNHLSSIGMEFISDLEVDELGNVLICGAFPYSLDLNPGPDTNMVVSNGQKDVFIAKYEGTTGAYIWGGSMGGTKMDQTESIELDNYGGFYLCGYFNDSVDFDPQAGVTLLVNPNPFDQGFFLKFKDGILTSQASPQDPFSLIVYPNPTDGLLHIDCGQSISSVEIWSLSGKCLGNWKVQSPLFTADLDTYATGLYLLRVYSGDQVISRKLVVD